ncbi:hypothetical protein C8J57DRAFT_1234066 [Mycena rebaudengoi]|nr:hypothetical protein C8J57DRAFT_1240535 [Mycena rebaudengoi]KAJ7259077.1 hypothetical protein C8J57DRAFT_1234066 [Mycena rebaudengoi]
MAQMGSWSNFRSPAFPDTPIRAYRIRHIYLVAGLVTTKNKSEEATRVTPTCNGDGLCASPTPCGPGGTEGRSRTHLNGDLLDDLLDGRVSGCPSDGDLALNAVFAAVASDAVNSGEAAKRMLNFRSQHAIYDEDYRPPTYRRDDASQFKPREAILVSTKRKGDGDINGEKPSNRANRTCGKDKIK